MTEFLNLTPPDEALEKLLSQLVVDPEVEGVDTTVIAADGSLFDESKARASINKVAQEEVMRLARATTVYLDGKAPWKAIKEDPATAGTSVYVTLRVIDNLKMLFAPFLPHTCQRLHEYLGYEGQLFGLQYADSFVEEKGRQHTALCYDNSSAVGRWEPSQLASGKELRQPGPLFKKIEPDVAEEEIQRLLG